MRTYVTVNRSPESKGTDFQHPQCIFSWHKPLSLVDDLFTLVPSKSILFSLCFTLAEAFVGLSDLWFSNVCQDSHSLERLAKKEGKSFKCGPEEIRPQTMDRKSSLSKARPERWAPKEAGDAVTGTHTHTSPCLNVSVQVKIWSLKWAQNQCGLLSLLQRKQEHVEMQSRVCRKTHSTESIHLLRRGPHRWECTES